jgi:very-short-patch-repair endonuclease
MREEIKLIARDLRKNQTEAENILWKRLRNREFLGKKFLRQHPIVFRIEKKERFFIADFYCREKRLVVEIDGKIHLKQKEYDQYREIIIQALGLHVIRVGNDMIRNDLEKFLQETLTQILSG